MPRENNQAVNSVTIGCNGPIMEAFFVIILLHTEQALVFALSVALGRQQDWQCFSDWLIELCGSRFGLA